MRTLRDHIPTLITVMQMYSKTKNYHSVRQFADVRGDSPMTKIMLVVSDKSLKYDYEAANVPGSDGWLGKAQSEVEIFVPLTMSGALCRDVLYDVTDALMANREALGLISVSAGGIKYDRIIRAFRLPVYAEILLEH